MFWASSRLNNCSSETSDSDWSVTSDPEELWCRPSRVVRRSRASTRTRRFQRFGLRQSWIGGLFHSARPSVHARRTCRKRKKRMASCGFLCRPQSSQEWGLLFLSLLLVMYLLDFFKLLYRDNQVMRADSTFSVDNNESFISQKGLTRSVLRSSSAVGAYASVLRSGSQPGSISDFQTEGNGANGSLRSQTERANHRQGSARFSEVDARPTRPNYAEPLQTQSHGEREVKLPFHPMNRNIVELQVPEDIGILAPKAIKQFYRRLAEAYVAPFKNGIYRQMFFDILRRRTYSLTPPGANKGVQTMLFQIIDGKVFMMDPYEVPRNSKPFYRTRINEVIWLLSKLAGEGRLRNTEFLLAIHDCVQTVNRRHEYRGAHYQESNPTFTIVACNFSDNVPFPMWEGSKHRDGGFSGWDDTVKKYAVDDTPWNMKKDRAVFRGGNRPSMYFRNKTDADLHCHDVGRTRLQFLSQQQPDVLDVSIGGTCGGVHTHLDRLEPHEHHKYKYILYAEGNCMWADRTRTQVFGPSTIVKQETPCGQFFEPLMKPYTHYIPTDFFFTDTVEKVLWARYNDEKASQIVKNANQFAQNFLTLQGIEAYVEVLLDEYTKLLVEPDIKLENGAVDVTDRRV